MTFSNFLNLFHQHLCIEQQSYNFTITFFDYFLGATKREKKNIMLNYARSTVSKFYNGKIRLANNKLKVMYSYIDRDSFIDFLSIYENFQIDMFVNSLKENNCVIDDDEIYESIADIAINLFKELIK